MDAYHGLHHFRCISPFLTALDMSNTLGRHRIRLIVRYVLIKNRAEYVFFSINFFDLKKMKTKGSSDFDAGNDFDFLAPGLAP